MIVGIATWELHLNGCASLKDKRRIMKSLKDRLHNRFNVSVAETARRHAESVLSAADKLVADDGLARIVDSAINYL